MLLRVSKISLEVINTSVREFKIRYLPVSHTSGTNDQDSLLDLLRIISSFRTRTICLTERLINCSHGLDIVERHERIEKILRDYLSNYRGSNFGIVT